jgi:hypothetical protein
VIPLLTSNAARLRRKSSAPMDLEADDPLTGSQGRSAVELIHQCVEEVCDGATFGDMVGLGDDGSLE